MLSSAVLTFDDPDEYTTEIRAAQVQLSAMERGKFASKLVRIGLDHLWMQRFSETLPRLGRTATSPARTIIFFPTTVKAPTVLGGREMVWQTVHQFGKGQELFQRTMGPGEWGSMSLACDDFAAVVENVTHHRTKVQTDSRTITPSPEHMTTLLRLHAAAGALAESAPSVLANPEAARSLEQELILAMVACTTTGSVKEDSVALRHHQQIMQRFRALAEANAGNPLYLPEICATLGVSVRTLQRCCHEHLGVSPLRYLWLRRMQMVHRALVTSPPASRNVTDAATGYGFWELGRFSVEYRALFGERPSETLSRQAGDILRPT